MAAIVPLSSKIANFGKMKTFLFVDFDNTLMATEQFALPPLIDRFNALYGASINAPLTLEVFKKHFHGQGRETLSRNLGAHFGIEVDYAALYAEREALMMRHLKAVRGGIPMAPNVIEALTAFKNAGATVAFVSNNPVERAMAALRYASNGRGAELAAVFGTNWFEAGDIQKPRPDVYLRAMEQLEADPKASFAIEDSPSGIKAALTAGLRVYAYTGFHEDKNIGDELMALGCAGHFRDWADLKLPI